MSQDGYLPPGCSHRDVDIAAGALKMCPVCDTWTYDDVCPECGLDFEEEYERRNQKENSRPADNG